MRYTNKFNLPEVFVKALQNRKWQHKGADYSASMLLKPVQMVMLEKKYKEQLEIDVSDCLWQLLGTALHEVLQKGEDSESLVEEYLVEQINGVKISGTADHYSNGTISDYKSTSVWSWIYRHDKIQEWESQLNIYAWLYRKAGFNIKNLQIIMILRDFQQTQTVKSNYPACPVQVIPINLWDFEKQTAYINLRVGIYEKYKTASILPECTDQERWCGPPKYAIMKKGNKRAVKIHQDLALARGHLSSLGQLYYIESRLDKPTKRCEYCTARKFCNQYKTLKKGE